MGLFSTTASTIGSSTKTQISSGVSQTLSQVKTQISGAESQAKSIGSNIVGNVTGGVTTAVGNVVSGVRSQAAKLESDVATTAAGYLKSAVSYVGSELSGFTSVFSSKETALASQINGFFKNTFSDTASPSTTTPNTQITDPVKTMLASGNPNVAAYKLTSGSGTPIQVSQRGTVTQPTGVSALSSTQTQTLQTRFNLDDLTNLPALADKIKTATGVQSVYQDLFDLPKNVVGAATTAVSSSISEVEQSIGTTVSSGVSSLIGTFLPDEVGGKSFTNVDGNGTISTTNTSVTAADVNAYTGIAKSLGCTTMGNYSSDSATSTTASLLVHATSTDGLTELTKAMMDCGVFASAKNDKNLSTTITALAGSQLPSTNLLLSYMKVPQILNTPDYTQAVLTDTATKKSDAAAITAAFATIGTTPVKVATVPDAMAGTAYPTMDMGLLANTNTDLLSGLFPKTKSHSVLAAVMQGQYVGTDSTGQLTI